MAVQINEVIIRAVVDPRPGEAQTSQISCPPDSSGLEGELVEKVLEILKEKSER